MGSHRQIRRHRVPGIRGLVLSAREMLVLAGCVLGIITAWLFYAASGPAHGQPAFGQEAADDRVRGRIRQAAADVVWLR